MFNPAAKDKSGVNGGISTVFPAKSVADLLGNVTKMIRNVANAIGIVTNLKRNVTETLKNVANTIWIITKMKKNVVEPLRKAADLFRNVAELSGNVSDAVKFFFMSFVSVN
jgi:ABC-type transporter Mla subunit MlaD